MTVRISATARERLILGAISHRTSGSGLTAINAATSTYTSKPRRA